MEGKDLVYDVVVIGGGAAGLKATGDLLKGGLKKVLLLESRDRVGGRIFSKQLECGSWIEYGANWQSRKHQDNLEELIQEFKFEKSETFRTGKSVVWEPTGEKKLVSFDNSGMSWMGLADAALFFLTLYRKCSGLNFDSPIKGNEKYDSMTAEEFINSTMWTDNAKKNVRYVLEGAFCRNLKEVSVLSLVYFLKTIPTTDDGDCYYLTGGLQNLLKKYAEPFKDNIRFNSKVIHIDSSSSPIVVTTESKQTYKAKTIVLAFPPPLLTRISFEPPLPEGYELTAKTQVCGRVLKLVGEFKTPWWRSRGFCGKIVSFTGKFMDEAYDISHEKAGVLAGFVVGDRALEVVKLGKEELTKRFNDFMVECFGEGGEPLKELHFHNWLSDEDTLAAYTSVPNFGMWKHHSKGYFHCTEPIYFAGTEYSRSWTGAMEGALESGKQVAKRILKAKGLQK